MAILNYEVYLTPLDVFGNYLTEAIDISDFVILEGVPLIKKELDQGDFQIGVFNYQSITIRVDNRNGEFNEKILDYRSIFPAGRDRAKILINFLDSDGNSDISYKGIITDRATKQDLLNEIITFTVLSFDSVFSQQSILENAIADGTLFSDAIFSILTKSFTTPLLSISKSDINLTLDLQIDDGSYFDNLLLKTALDQLLLASNSVLLIDDNDNIIIRSREENTNTPYVFYHNDQFKRDNIKGVANFNNGLQRMFNSVVVNNVESRDQDSIDLYGVRQKSITLSFMSNTTSLGIIGQSIVGEFATPRIEMELLTDVDSAKDIAFLDKVNVDYDLRISPAPNPNGIVPLYEVDEYEKSHYPYEIGDLRIDPRKIFKVIAFFENSTTYNTTVKLRDTGELI
jgi:hypothetical protein